MVNIHNLEMFMLCAIDNMRTCLVVIATIGITIIGVVVAIIVITRTIILICIFVATIVMEGPYELYDEALWGSICEMRVSS